jgi:hypothetical protein
MVYLLRAASEDNPRNNLAQIPSFWEGISATFIRTDIKLIIHLVAESVVSAQPISERE